MGQGNYKWVICAAGTLLMITVHGLTATGFTVYLPYLISVNGFTNTETSSLTTVQSLTAFLVMFGITRYYALFNIRIGTTLAALSGAAAFFLFSLAESYALCVAAACFLGASYALGGMVPITIAVDRWFTERKATAMSICSAGSGIAAMFCPPVITACIEGTSLARAFLLEALFIVAIAAVIFLLMRNAPKEGAGGSSGKKKRGNAAASLDRTGMFLMLTASMLMGCVAIPGTMHLAVLFKTEGYDALLVAYVLSLNGAGLIAGKLIYGLITDRIGAFRSNFIFLGFAFAGLAACCLAGSQSPILPFAAVFCLGLGFPVATIGLSVWAGDLSSSEQFENNVKRFQLSYTFGMLLFSVIPGILADCFGSYIPAYALLALFSLAVLALVQQSYRMTLPH